MNDLKQNLALILATAWVGGLWAIGYLAAPVLFHYADDTQFAGMLAGHLFTWMAYLGLLSGGYLLLHFSTQFGWRLVKQAVFWVVLLMLLLTLAGQFGIQPVITELKMQALPADVMHSLFADRFKTWHGLASIAYLAESLLGIVLIIKIKR